MDELRQFKQAFDVYLKNILDSKIGSIAKYTKDSSIINYFDHARKIILSSGKRIRPYTAFLMYKALEGKEDERVLKLLVSLELFHSFCLMHDDIMDKSNLRHGVPTMHTHISKTLKEENRTGDLDHVSNSQAILIGDLLFSWSQEILNFNTDFDQKIMQKIKTHYYEMTEEVVIGQMIDVDIATRKTVSKELIDQKTCLKTAGYSFIKPLQIGAALAGKETKEVENFCKEFGLRIGIAFQVQDDLLDIISSDSKLGKTTALDKSQNQHTYFTYFPSLEYGKKIIVENFKQARNLINNSSINANGKKKFIDLVDFIQTRSS